MFLKKSKTREDSRLFKNVVFFQHGFFKNQMIIQIDLCLRLNIMVPWATTSTLIILFERMLHFLKIVFPNAKILWRKLKNPLQIFKNIPFIAMKLPSHYDKYLTVQNILT